MCVLHLQSYDHGIAQGPYLESHGKVWPPIRVILGFFVVVVFSYN